MVVKEFTQDRLRVRIYETRSAMGQAAAEAAVRAIKDLLERQETVNIIFAAAPSQNEVLAGVAASGLDFRRVHAFHLDEYLGLAPEAPQRFSSYLQEHIFGKVELAGIHLLGAGTCEDPQEECARYAALLKQYPPDISFIGIGENGHIAFNDPHVADFADPVSVKVVELDDLCRMQQVHDGCFPRMEDVPGQALTLTIPAVLQAKHVICTVPGAAKAGAVKHAVYGEIAESCPASAMRQVEGCTLFCDRDSGAYLL